MRPVPFAYVDLHTNLLQSDTISISLQFFK